MKVQIKWQIVSPKRILYIPETKIKNNNNQNMTRTTKTTKQTQRNAQPLLDTVSDYSTLPALSTPISVRPAPF